MNNCKKEVNKCLSCKNFARYVSGFIFYSGWCCSKGEFYYFLKVTKDKKHVITIHKKGLSVYCIIKDKLMSGTVLKSDKSTTTIRTTQGNKEIYPTVIVFGNKDDAIDNYSK